MITVRRPKRVSAAVFGSLLLTGLAGCGGNDTAAVTPPPPAAQTSAAPTIGVITTVSPIQPASGLAPTPATATIRMYIDHPFEPATLTVAPATLITVINEGSGANDICNMSDPAHGINSNDLGPGASTHIIAPDTPGTYNYSCSYYPDTMKGTLIVSKDVTTPSSATPTPTITATPTPTSTTSSGGSSTGTGSTGSGSTGTGSTGSGSTGTGSGSDSGGSSSGGSDSGGSDSGGSNSGSSDSGSSDNPNSSPTFDPVKRAHNCTKPHFRANHPALCAPYPA